MSDAAARLAATLGPLPLGRARARTAQHHGRHPRRTAGPGDAFWQYRPLEPGEGVARVDWRKSARSDTLLVREREREDPVRLLIWRDGSGSMDFASRGGLATKVAAAQLICNALAIAAHAADEQVRRLGAPSQPLDQLLAHSGNAPLGATAALRPGDAVVLAGDFLDGDAPTWIREAARAGAIGVALHVVDPAEEAFPFAGRLRFDPSEPDDPAMDLARAEDIRTAYLSAWAAHVAALDALATEPGWTLVRHRTDADPATALARIAGWLRG